MNLVITRKTFLARHCIVMPPLPTRTNPITQALQHHHPQAMPGEPTSHHTQTYEHAKSAATPDERNTAVRETMRSMTGPTPASPTPQAECQICQRRRENRQLSTSQLSVSARQPLPFASNRPDFAWSPLVNPSTRSNDSVATEDHLQPAVKAIFRRAWENIERIRRRIIEAWTSRASLTQPRRFGNDSCLKNLEANKETKMAGNSSNELSPLLGDVGSPRLTNYEEALAINNDFKEKEGSINQGRVIAWGDWP